VIPSVGAALLTVTVPPGTDLSSSRILARPAGSSGAILSLKPGESKAVSAGTLCLWTEGLNPARKMSEACISLAEGSAQTYRLGSVQFVRSTNDFIYGLDGVRAGLGYEPPDPDQIRALLSHTEQLAHVPGTFAYRAAALGVFEISVEADKNTVFDVSSLIGQGAIRLLPPASRSLPDHGSGINGIEGLDLVYGGRHWSGVHYPYFVAMQQPVAFIGWSGFAPLRLGPVSKPLGNYNIEFPPPGTIKEIQLQRLDVADVQMTLPDGTKQSVKGKVTIQYQNPADGLYHLLGKNMNTGYGVDLPPGRYRIYIFYTSPLDGAAQYLMKELTL
jgi:hypothetical protein